VASNGAGREHVTRSRSNPGGGDAVAVLGEVLPFRERKPAWFKVQMPGGNRYRELDKLIGDQNLHTVCREAACPNIGECWERGTATFMILGDTCTRRCGFCHVKTGKPTWNDPLEPLRVAQSVRKMGLRHAVITSVDRDDLPDYGAGVWCGVIRSIRRLAPGCKVECLTPDFRGQEMPLARVIAERPDVLTTTSRWCRGCIRWHAAAATSCARRACSTTRSRWAATRWRRSRASWWAWVRRRTRCSRPSASCASTTSRS
jgi:lipoic acid synthetase